MELDVTRYLSKKDAMKYMGIGSYNTLKKLVAKGLKVTVTPYGERLDIKDIDEFMAQYKI